MDQLRPQLIFSAHSHHSAYTQLEGSEMVKMTDKFLMAHKHPSRQWALEGVPFLGYTAKPKSEITADDTLQLQTSATITLQFDKGSRTVHEITVPTCSYRMGTPHPGFGAFHLCKNKLSVTICARREALKFVDLFQIRMEPWSTPCSGCRPD